MISPTKVFFESKLWDNFLLELLLLEGKEFNQGSDSGSWDRLVHNNNVNVLYNLTAILLNMQFSKSLTKAYRGLLFEFNLTDISIDIAFKERVVMRLYHVLKHYFVYISFFTFFKLEMFSCKMGFCHWTCETFTYSPWTDPRNDFTDRWPLTD